MAVGKSIIVGHCPKGVPHLRNSLRKHDARSRILNPERPNRPEGKPSGPRKA